MAFFDVHWDESINLLTLPQPFFSGATFYVIQNTDGTLTSFIGTGFTYDLAGYLNGGTITSVNLSAATGETLQTITDITVSAADLFGAALMIGGIRDDLNALDIGFFNHVPDPQADINLAGDELLIELADGRFVKFVGSGFGFNGEEPIGTVDQIFLVQSDTTTIDESYTPPDPLTFFEAVAVLFLTGQGGLTYRMLNEGATTVIGVYSGAIGADFYQHSMEDQPGNDIFIGSPTAQTVDFGYSAGPIFWTASSGAVFHASGDMDILVNITGLLGTEQGDMLDGRAAQSGVYLYGEGGNDSLLGGIGDDVLFAGAGSDLVDGGAGIDTASYATFEDGAVTVNLTTGAATGAAGGDVLRNMENVAGTDFGDTIIGNALANRLDGNDGVDTIDGGAGNDTIDGGLGADTMSGGDGDDILLVDNAADVVNEADNAGIDEVRTSVTYILTAGAAIERLVALGSSAINLTGNARDNTLIGNSAANVLSGGLGNDIYVINDALDTITENAAQGVDIIQSSITYSLAAIANVEGLTLTGTAAINGTGNALSNSLVGNSANNVLAGGDGNDMIFGGAGADTLAGGNGDDMFFIENVGDVVLDPSGNDTVVASGIASATLGATIERLILGNGVTTGIGNGLNNVITGNALNNALQGGAGNDTLDGGAGNDTLDGGLGADVMVGGVGNDTYIVDNASDTTLDVIGGGVDTVQSSITRALGANIENLTLTGAAVINGVGNALANTIAGNGAANILTGNPGADTLQGNGGADSLAGGLDNDTLTGGTGTDNFIFNTAPNSASNRDTITDFTAVDDTIQLENAIFTSLSATGVLNAAFLRVGAAAADANDYIIYNNATGGLFYDADGNGVGAAVQFATLTAGLALTSADFVVI